MIKVSDDVYANLTADEVAALPTVFRDDLFRDRVVLVSGGAGGIGFATSVLFGRLGATIVSCGRDPEKMARFEKDLSRLDIACFTHPMTIRDPDQVADLMTAVWERYGKLDVLVNNAGGQFAAPALDITPKGWNAVIDTNLTGSWYMMQAAARQWRDHDQPGCIINMVAVPGMCSAGVPHTVAARAGEIHLSKSLSVEWAPHRIRVNCVAIGIVASPGLVNYPETAKPSFDHNPMRRAGHVQDIAEACVYLAAPSGNFVNGTVLVVDGGADVWGEYWPLGRPDYFQIDY
jgi:NAD(P)-dependent dehydrogenase (short-subunit alcohol dehydrogenase family)